MLTLQPFPPTTTTPDPTPPYTTTNLTLATSPNPPRTCFSFPTFVGLTVTPGTALVDTGAQHGVCGLRAFTGLEEN